MRGKRCSAISPLILRLLREAFVQTSSSLPYAGLSAGDGNFVNNLHRTVTERLVMSFFTSPFLLSVVTR